MQLIYCCQKGRRDVTSLIPFLNVTLTNVKLYYLTWACLWLRSLTEMSFPSMWMLSCDVCGLCDKKQRSISFRSDCWAWALICGLSCEGPWLLVGVRLQPPTFVKRSSLPFSGNRILFQSYWHLDGRCHHVALISSSLICFLFAQSIPFFTNSSTASPAIEQQVLFFIFFLNFGHWGVRDGLHGGPTRNVLTTKEHL